MVKTRSFGLWWWSVGLLAGLVMATECAGSEPAATGSAARLVVPDEYATIQAAIRDADEGDTVWVKAGTYNEAVELKSRIKLVGEQKDSTIVQFDDSRSVVVAKDCADVSIAGLTIRHVTTLRRLGMNAGVVVDNSTILIEDCRIAGAAGSGLEIANKAHATVRDCNIVDSGARGVEVRKAATAVLETCEIARNSVLGIVVIGRETTGTIRRCRITGSQFAGIGFWLAGAGTARENEIAENEVGIEVRDGCPEVVLFQNQCRGNRREGIKICARAQAHVEENLCAENGGEGITIGGRETFAVLKKNRCLRNAEHGILVYAEGVGTIAGNECSENKQDGIYINRTFSDIAVEANRCADNERTGITVFDIGGGEIAENECRSNWRNGLYVRRTVGMVTVRGNRCLGNEQEGISLADETQTVVQNNVSSENGQCGIMIYDGASSLAQANTCEGNGCPGIWVQDPNTTATLRENTCCANNNSGILFANVVEGRAERNLCRENLWSGIAVRGEGAVPILTANRCNNNGAWGIISWAGAQPEVSADNETRDNWKGGIKRRPPSREDAATPGQM